MPRQLELLPIYALQATTEHARLPDHLHIGAPILQGNVIDGDCGGILEPKEGSKFGKVIRYRDSVVDQGDGAMVPTNTDVVDPYVLTAIPPDLDLQVLLQLCNVDHTRVLLLCSSVPYLMRLHHNVGRFGSIHCGSDLVDSLILLVGLLELPTAYFAL